MYDRVHPNINGRKGMENGRKGMKIGRKGVDVHVHCIFFIVGYQGYRLEYVFEIIKAFI